MDEKLLPLEMARQLPWLPKPISRTNIYRHVRPGLRGQRLRVTRASGCLCTTEAWLREFFDAVAAAGQSGSGHSARGHTDATRATTPGHRRAENLLDAIGI